MKFIDHIRQRSLMRERFMQFLWNFRHCNQCPIISFISGKPLADSGVLAVIVSLIAMLWNYLFNLLFDKLQCKYHFNRSLGVRIIHGIGFEVGLILLTIPTIALLFRIGFIDAFLLEISMLIYFFPYTIFFNWIYDKIRLSLVHNYDKTNPSKHLSHK